MATKPADEESHAAEEPEVVAGPNGVMHPPPIRAAAFLGLVQAGEILDRRLDQDLQVAHGISLRAYEVLLHLAVFSEGGKLRMSALAAQAPLSQSRVSRLVADLAERGLVTRNTSPGDSRGVEVAITKVGLETLRAAQDTHHAGLHTRFFANLSWDEVVLLARVTRRLLAANDQPRLTRDT